MNERRPPTKPGRPGARVSARPERGGRSRAGPDEQTESSPRPAPRPGVHSGGGFDDGANTTGAVRELGSSDISLIDAEDLGPAPSDSGFAMPPRASVFVPPPGAIDGSTFGADRATAEDTVAEPEVSTDSLKSGERPPEVKKWRMGGEDEPARPQRIRTSVVPLPPTNHDDSRDVVRAPPLRGRAHAATADLATLRRLVEEAEELLRGLGPQLSSREGHGARAQLNAALHRLSEALDLLRGS